MLLINTNAGATTTIERGTSLAFSYEEAIADIVNNGVPFVRGRSLSVNPGRVSKVQLCKIAGVPVSRRSRLPNHGGGVDPQKISRSEWRALGSPYRTAQHAIAAWWDAGGWTPPEVKPSKKEAPVESLFGISRRSGQRLRALIKKDPILAHHWDSLVGSVQNGINLGDRVFTHKSSRLQVDQVLGYALASHLGGVNVSDPEFKNRIRLALTSPGWILAPEADITTSLREGSWIFPGNA